MNLLEMFWAFVASVCVTGVLVFLLGFIATLAVCVFRYFEKRCNLLCGEFEPKEKQRLETLAQIQEEAQKEGEYGD